MEEKEQTVQKSQQKAKPVKQEVRPKQETAEVPPEIMAQIKNQQEAKHRAEACMQELQVVLKKHNCNLDPVILIDGRGMQRSWQVVANPNQPG